MQKVKKVLLLPKYPRLGASSRVRTYQFIPLWEKQGYQVTVSSFFNLTYLFNIYSHRRPYLLNVLGCYVRRLKFWMTAWRYDVVMVEKEMFPYLPAFYESFLSMIGVTYIVDYDDAVFHNYDRHGNALVRSILGNKIDQIMNRAGAVWVGNTYLAERARYAGATNIRLIPTTVDLGKYHIKDHKESLLPVIGWIGSPTTIKYLRAMLPMLERLRKTIPFKLLVIGQNDALDYSGELETALWTEELEGEQVARLDIGLMPLPNSAWEQGKCAYKLIQYMACGLPVVASPIGMNKDVVRPGINGFLADSDEEWITHLTTLLQDTNLRRQMGLEGRKLVEAEYTVERNWEKMMGWLMEEEVEHGAVSVERELVEKKTVKKERIPELGAEH